MECVLFMLFAVRVINLSHAGASQIVRPLLTPDCRGSGCFASSRSVIVLQLMIGFVDFASDSTQPHRGASN